MRNRCESFQNTIRERETILETMRMLVKLKLIAKRIDLMLTVVYYEICNTILRTLIKVIWKK